MGEVKHIRDGLVFPNNTVQVCWAKFKVARSETEDRVKSIFLRDSEPSHNVRCNAHHGFVGHHSCDGGEDGGRSLS